MAVGIIVLLGVVVLILSGFLSHGSEFTTAEHCADLGDENGFCYGAEKEFEWSDFDNGSMPGLDEGHCNIERVNAISNEEFLFRYAFDKPVIFVGVNDNTIFRKLSTRKSLLENYANNTITVSTANTHSYQKVNMPLSEYIDRFLRPQSVDSLGRDTLYFFGNNNHTEWADLFDVYMQPPYELPGKTGAYSFGFAGAGTGVPFHFHGPGFAEVIYGRKRWFLYPYENEPNFDPDQNVLRWVLEDYPKLAPQEKPLECTIKPGEVLYFPNLWWHSTLNLETSVFMSTFLG